MSTATKIVKKPRCTPGSIGFLDSARDKQIAAHSAKTSLDPASRFLREIVASDDPVSGEQDLLNVAFVHAVDAALVLLPHVTSVEIAFGTTAVVVERRKRALELLRTLAAETVS